MSNSRLAYLFQRWTNGTATAEEKAEWLALMDLPENEDAVRSLIDEYLREEKEMTVVSDEMTAVLLNKTFSPRIQPRRIQWRLAAAAIFFALAATGAFLLTRNKTQQSGTVAQKKTAPKDADPGNDKALLTLADGSTVTLDSAGHQTMKQSGIVVTQQGGQLLYTGAPTEEISYNTLTTPRGSQFRLKLPDGTLVWLNAASSLRYPVAFDDSDRTVELTGEAYFEVAKDVSRPFHIKASSAKVDVLGTHFNVMAYADEEVTKTTLLEGAVRASSVMGSRILSPGEQAVVQRASGTISSGPGNIEEAIAWKEGYFLFDGADLPVLLRQFGRWYNIDVVYKGQHKAYEFVGKIPRTAHLSSILKVFEANDIQYTFENGRLTITP